MLTSDRPQADTLNRYDCPLVPLVGETAVRLAPLGLHAVRVPPAPRQLSAHWQVRTRRDRVGRTGELRSLVADDATGHSLLMLVFLPSHLLDLGAYAIELFVAPTSVSATFTMHAADGTWFAGHHAHGAYSRARATQPDLVPDPGMRSARARERGLSFQARLAREELPRLESLHRTLWSAYQEGLTSPLELTPEASTRNARGLDGWRTWLRTQAATARHLVELPGGEHLARQYDAVITAPA